MGGAGSIGVRRTMEQTMGVARNGSAPATASSSRRAPSASASAGYAREGYWLGLSIISSSVSSSLSSGRSLASTATLTSRRIPPHARVNRVRPGTSPALLARGTGIIPTVLQHPSHGTLHGAESAREAIQPVRLELDSSLAEFLRLLPLPRLPLPLG